MIRWTLVVAVIGVVAVGCGVAVAANGVPGGGNGNTPAAQLCKNGGWQSLVRADQTPFLDQGECVAYASQGGVPALPSGSYAATRAACGAIFGTFAVPGTNVATFGQAPQGYVLLWTCNAWPYTTQGTSLATFGTQGGYCDVDTGSNNYFTLTTSNNPLGTQPPSGSTGIACYQGP